jgi:hypothetical protein
MSDDLEKLAESLCSLGESILTASENKEEEAVLVLLERYVDEFDRWNTRWTDSSTDKSLSIKDAEKILDVHEAVCLCAQQMTVEAGQSMKNMRGWSKGIRAYIDHFPSKISTTRGKKG